MVAVIELAIALGATVGGVFYDMNGYRSTFAVSATVLCASAFLAKMACRGGLHHQSGVSKWLKTREL